MAFDLKAVERGIAGTQFAGRVIHFASVDSTNTLALEAAQSGARTGVRVADEQTAGRGRGGHTWHSSIGDGLYVSALVTPPLAMDDALLLSLATGLAAQAAIAEIAGLSADIRWPNDLLINSKKCGGILVETAVTPATSATSAMLRHAVIGIGINLNHESFPPELEHLATSLKREGEVTIHREALLIALLRRLDDELYLLTAENRDNNLLQRFSEASTWVRGKRVRVDEAGGYTGVTVGLDSRGFLQVNSDDGRRRTVLSGGLREV